MTGHRDSWRISVAALILAAAYGSLGAVRGELPQTSTFERVLSEARAKARSKDWREASSLWAQVVEMNPQVAPFWGELARAHYEAKDYRKAIGAYEKAIELGNGYPWASAYDIACCHALLGDKAQAMKWLEKSFAMGCRNLKDAQTDTDLNSLHGDQRFKDLVGLVDVSTMSRDQGWCYDLGHLAREIKRLHYNLRRAPTDQFDAAVKELHDRIPKLTDCEIQVGFMKLMRMAGDGHTLIKPPCLRDETRRALPVVFYFFTEGLFITLAEPKHGDLLGMQVLRFGERTIDQVMEALDTVISQDNKTWPKFVAPNLMRNPQILNGLGLIPDSDKVQLTLRDADGKERTVTLLADSTNPTGTWLTARHKTPGPEPLYLKNLAAAYWFEYLPDSKTLYFQYNRVQNDSKESLEQFSDRLFKFINDHEVARLVIDMRWNHGGNNFLNRPLVLGLIRCDKINQRGKLFVIVGRNTFSAAMCGATQIERYTNAIFVGEPTGSSPNFVGESIPVFLPYSKMRGTISDLFWQNSIAMDYRTWLAPTIYAPPSFGVYRAKRDPAMEAILGYPAKEPSAASSSGDGGDM
jgi:tetratricopeptide (TPR) repeat protein